MACHLDTFNSSRAIICYVANTNKEVLVWDSCNSGRMRHLEKGFDVIIRSFIALNEFLLVIASLAFSL